MKITCWLIVCFSEHTPRRRVYETLLLFQNCPRQQSAFSAFPRWKARLKILRSLLTNIDCTPSLLTLKTRSKTRFRLDKKSLMSRMASPLFRGGVNLCTTMVWVYCNWLLLPKTFSDSFLDPSSPTTSIDGVKFTAVDQDNDAWDGSFHLPWYGYKLSVCKNSR